MRPVSPPIHRLCPTCETTFLATHPSLTRFRGLLRQRRNTPAAAPIAPSAQYGSALRPIACGDTGLGSPYRLWRYGLGVALSPAAIRARDRPIACGDTGSGSPYRLRRYGLRIAHGAIVHDANFQTDAPIPFPLHAHTKRRQNRPLRRRANRRVVVIAWLRPTN